ncbi:MAG: sugar ABC transporter ATP-binding protein [Lachnospiraceae bacterium]|jgi:ABC-type sugar transport system ATPase subunit|nr:sugar ABC transporter ATP-binding protein [Lachnospiraceae bacterium]MCI9017528.1 sugar ABC transporter ATP-binding protein [Lachnospiraceae bacterium]MCI9305547.1 sugar ABC transporter ATP-binding protein [Lachnospiraceae bacterium]MCI9681086.1 sugar ABC transporter ATP-binding protein [Lachnospiraceae bacterium]
MEGICKTFPGVKALDEACILVKKGEVHALMGENGAGKSTLMKVLNGLLQPDKGRICLEGEEIKVENPAAALKKGIAMIYQELNPIRDMTVAENIFIGREFMKGLFVDKKKSEAEAEALLKRFGLAIDPRARMRTLSIAQMQMIEIMKAISSGAKLIVMDEPTSSLTDEEIKVLFQKIEELKKAQVSVIYISHRLEETFTIADAVTVMRDGRYIATRDVEELDKNTLIQMMVGRELSNIYPKEEAEIGKTVLEVKNLCGDRFWDISFQVRRGEILGFYGLVGAGRSEVFRRIFGMDSGSGGEICLDGKALSISRPYHAIRSGIVMVTEDRKEDGLVLCRSIQENIALPNLKRYQKGPFLNGEREKKECREIAGKMSVKMSGLHQLAGQLSGGNQQKVVLSKWLMEQPKVLILDEPTRGIDVGAKAEIYALMCEFAKQGLAIVMISSELPEVMGMSDRMIIMGEGRIRGEFRREEYAQDEILKSALGGKEKEEG